MKLRILGLLGLIFLVVITGGLASLDALIFKVYVLQYKQTRIMLLSDAHNKGSKTLNDKQMGLFFENIKKLSSAQNQPIHIILESMLLNGINLSEKSESAVAQAVNNTFKCLPTNISTDLTNFNTTPNSLYKINPVDPSLSSWIMWNFPTRFVRSKNKFDSSIKLTAIDPRQDIYLFGWTICNYLNNPSANSTFNKSLYDILEQIESLLKEFFSLTESIKDNDFLNFKKSLCEYKKNQQQALLTIFGSLENMKTLYPHDVVKLLNTEKKKDAFFALFGITKANPTFHVSSNTMGLDTFLGNKLIEVAFMVNILQTLKATSAPQTIFVLAGHTHTKSLSNILPLLNITLNKTFPDYEKEANIAYQELLGLFNKISLD